MTFLTCQSIQNVPYSRPLSVLLDSGSTTSWFNKNALPPTIRSTTAPSITGTTMAGEFQSDQLLTLSDVSLSELSDFILPTLSTRLFTASCRYDLILGRDVLSKFRIHIDFDKQTISGPHSRTVPMRQFPNPADLPPTDVGVYLATDHYENTLNEILTTNNDDNELTPLSDHSVANSSSPPTKKQKKDILPSLYETHDPTIIAKGCVHLSSTQQQQLSTLLSKFPTLFNGELKVYPHNKLHLDVDPSVKPFVSRAYPIPKNQLQIFKQELDRLVKIGVLEKQGRATWIAGTFIIPKKDNRVRWISDFRALNKAIVRRNYPIPKIQDILSRRSGYKFLTKLDLSMQYYTFELDEASKDLCTIATPFGLYRYARLPMGVSTSPDMAQEIMEQVLSNLEDTEVYLDDIAVFSSQFDSHISLLEKILQRLQDNGFSVNPLKCAWAVHETDFLGHWLTPQGIKPYYKKVNAIVQLEKPKNLKQLRSFLGMVTYYRDMWPRRSHILSPLTELLKTPTRFRWSPECDIAFKHMKSLVASETLLAYPDHNIPFHIETDASDLQLGAVIKQNGKPVAFYTRKLTPAQRNYSTIEKELLSIVETFREFRSMLLGADIHVYTDHKNLTHKLSQYVTQRVLRWRLLLEEYNPTFHYLKGPDNVLADTLSRLPSSMANTLSSTDSSAPARLPPSPPLEKITEALTFIDNLELAECLAEMPLSARPPDGPDNDVAPDPYHDCLLFHHDFDSQRSLPFHFATIHHYQQRDPWLQKASKQDERFYTQCLGSFKIICYRDSSPDWKIALPSNMLGPLIHWYHKTLAHAPGMDRLEALVKRTFYHPKIRDACRSIVSSCPISPMVRTTYKPYGHLAPRNAPVCPWSEVHVDCIGPWKVSLPDNNTSQHTRRMRERIFR